jgi:acyl-CoA thioesterase
MSGVAFFRLDGGLYHPQQTATQSWTRRHQNGSAVGGLLARAIEATPSVAPMNLARITIDMSRGTPLQPTEARVRVLRDGKRLQLVEAQLWVDGEAYASAVGLRVVDGESPAEPWPPHGLPEPEAAPRTPVTSALGEGWPMQTRIVRGGRGPGPGAYWTSFNAELVEGEPTSPMVRAVMACDIAAGVAAGVPRDWSFPNLDLSLHIARPPAGDWVLVEAETDQAGEGFGLVSSLLSDGEGRFGYAHQTLLYTKAD